MFINRLGGALGGIFGIHRKDAVQKNQDTAGDRDAQGSTGYEKKDSEPKFLTPEQEEAAVKKLNELQAFSKNGLKAILVRESEKAIHVQIVDPAGNVVRRIPYEQLIQMYFDRNRTDKSTGRILNRAA